MNDSPRPEDQATISPSIPPADQPTLPPMSQDSSVTLVPHEGQPVSSTDERAPEGYVIERELGRGGMGVVYKARSIALERDCALKMILAGVHSGETEIERFRTEAQAIARLQHPGIVQVFEIGEHDGKPFMALEFCAGGSLDAVLAKNPLKPRDAATLVKTLAEAMHAAHQANVIHRDLKPANVLLASPGRESGGSLHPKITDFGLAKKLDDQGATRTGSVMGTPSYMPPEQAEGKKDIGPAADIYALGAILYECLASRPPFRAATAFDTIIQVLTEEPVPLRQLNHQTPVDLDTIALKCLQKDPTKRYVTAQALADDLGRYLNGEPITARPVSRLERFVRWCKREPVVAGLLALILFGLGIGTAIYRRVAISALQNAERATEEKNLADTLRIRAEHLGYIGKLALAQREWQGTNVAGARRLLAECRFDLRGWEHGHLWKVYHSNQRTLTQDAGFLDCMAWSPDGSLLATGGFHGGILIWDVRSGEKVRSFGAEKRAFVKAIAWCDDGKQIVSTSDNDLQFWNAQTGAALRTLKGHTNTVAALSISPDGKRIASGSQDGTVKVWDIASGQCLFTSKVEARQIYSICWSPNGKQLVSTNNFNGCSYDLWDGSTGKHLRTVEGENCNRILWSPDGRRIVGGGKPGSLHVWDAQTCKKLFTLLGHTREITGMAISADGRRIVSSSEDQTLKLWDMKTGKELASLKGHTKDIRCVAFDPVGKRISSNGSERSLKVWEVDQTEEVRVITGRFDFRPWGRAVAFSKDGKRIFSGDFRPNAWDADKGTELPSANGKGHQSGITTIAVSPDGLQIVTGSTDNTLKIWDAQTGELKRTLEGHTRPVMCATWSPDGTTILSGGEDGQMKLWDARTGKVGRTLKTQQTWVNAVAFSPDGRTFVNGGMGDNNSIEVWETSTGNKLQSLLGHSDDNRGLQFSTDGKRIISAGEDRAIKIWDAESGREIVTCRGHTEMVTCVALSPDGKRIASGGGDRTLRIHDAENGQQLLALSGHTDQILSVAWSPDGKRIVSGSRDGSLRVWESVTAPTFIPLETAYGWPCFAVNPDGNTIVTGANKTVTVWETRTGQAIMKLEGPVHDINRVAISADGKRIFAAERTPHAVDEKGVQHHRDDKWYAWDSGTGKPVPVGKVPEDILRRSENSEVVNKEANLRVRLDRQDILIEQAHGATPTRMAEQSVDLHTWHRREASLAEAEKNHFAVAFHLGRLLRDDPDNADLKRRREQALALHEKTTRDNTPPRMEKVP